VWAKAIIREITRKITTYIKREGIFFFSTLRQSLKTCIFTPPYDEVSAGAKEHNEEPQNADIKQISGHSIVVVEAVKSICQQIYRVYIGEKGNML
jgi:hypothetical protein